MDRRRVTARSGVVNPTGFGTVLKTRIALPPFDELLLCAAVGSRERAVAAWREWRASNALDAIEGVPFGLLPLVLRNVEEETVATGDAGRLRGVCRSVWSSNQLVVRDAAPAIAGLREKGIEVRLVGPAAVVARFYSGAAPRPIAGLDLAIPEDGLLPAVALLRARGWRCDSARPEALARFDDAVVFRGGQGRWLRLHWRGYETARADPGDVLLLSGGAVPTLCAADLLVDACAGPWITAVQPLLALVDAAAILGAGEPDWQRVTASAHERGCALAVAAMLEALQRSAGSAVSEEVLSGLRSSVLPGDRLLFWSREGKWSGRLLRAARLLRRFRGGPFSARGREFLEYLSARRGEPAS